MPTDVTLLSIGVESSQAVKARENLAELTEAAAKVEGAVVKLTDAQIRNQTQAANWAATQERVAKATGGVADANDRWLQSQDLAARSLGKTHSEALQLEGAMRGLSQTQQEQLQTIIQYRDAYEKLQEQQRKSAEANQAAAQGTQSSTGFIQAFTDAVEKSSIATIASGAAIGAVFGNIIVNAVAAALSAVKNFVVGSVTAFADMQEALVRVDMMLKAVAASSGVTVEHVRDLAESMQGVTRFDSTDIERAAAVMLKFGSSSTEEFDRAMNAAAGLATVMGTDITSAAEMVGRAMENSYGASMLRRVGQLTDAQVEYLRALKEVASDEQYRSEMLTMLESKSGDAAKNVDGLTGAWTRFKNELHSMAESIGKGIDAVLGLEGAFRKVADALKVLREFNFEAMMMRYDVAVQNFIAHWLSSWADAIKQIPLIGAAMGATLDKLAEKYKAAAAASASALAHLKQPVDAETSLFGSGDAGVQAAAAAAKERNTAATIAATAALKAEDAAAKTLHDTFLKSLPTAEQRAKASEEFYAALDQGHESVVRELSLYTERYGIVKGMAKAEADFIAERVKSTKATDEGASILERFKKMSTDAQIAIDQLSMTTDQKMTPAMKALIETLGDEKAWDKLTKSTQQQIINAALDADALQKVQQAGEAAAKTLDELAGAGKGMEKQTATYEQEAESLRRYGTSTRDAAKAQVEFLISTKEVQALLNSSDAAIRKETEAKVAALRVAAALNDAARQNRDSAQSWAKESENAVRSAEQYEKSLSKQADAMNEQARTMGFTSKELEHYKIATAEAELVTLKLALAVAQVEQQAGKGNESEVAALQKMIAERENLINAARNLSAAAINKETAALNEHAKTLGMTKEQLAAYQIAQADANVQTVAAELAAVRAKDANDARIPGLEKTVDALQKNADAMRNVGKSQVALDFTRAWSDAFRDVSRRAEDFLVDFYHNGSSAFKRLWEDFVEWALRAIARVMLQKIVLNITANTSLAGAAQQAFGGTGGGGGSILDLFGNKSGSWLTSGYNSFATSGIGQSIGLSTAPMMGADFWGAGAEFGTVAAGGGLTSSGAALGTFFTAVAPYAAAAMIAVPIIASMFDKEPSKVRGRFMISEGTTGFEDNAYLRTRYGNFGFSDADTQQFSGEYGKTFSKIVSDAIDAFDTRFSKEQSDHFAEVLKNMVFESFEGEYTTEDFIKKYGAKITKQIVSAAFDEIDPVLASAMRAFSSEDVQAVISYTNTLLAIYDITKDLTAADHALVDAMLDGTQAGADLALAYAAVYAQTEKLTEADQKLVNSLLHGTQASAALAATFASAYAVIEDAQRRQERATLQHVQKTTDATLGSDVLTAMEGSSPTTVFTNTAQSLRELMDAYKGTAEQTQALAEATNAYYQAEVQLLAQINNIKIAIGEMFGDTIRSMRLQTMTQQQQYEFYRQEAQDLYQQMMRETDPAKIQSLASRINADYMAAFNLLTPEQQQAMLGQFSSSINEVNEYAQQHLTEISGTIQQAAHDMFDEVHQKLDDAVTKLAAASDKQATAAETQVTAANTQVDAANTQNTAANTPRKIVVVDQYGNEVNYQD